jgi:hypothetical protein
MCLLWKFSMPFLVKPASSVKSTRLLRKGSSSKCRRNHWKNSWRGRKSSELGACACCKWYGYGKCSLIIGHSVVCTTFLAARIRSTLAGTCTSRHALFPCTCPSSLCTIQGLPDATISVVRRALFEVYAEIPLHEQLWAAAKLYTLSREVSAYRRVLRMCSCPF